MTDPTWLSDREAEIAALAPQLMCRKIVDDVRPGQPQPPCDTLTPAMVRQMLFERTGVTGWRVRIVGVDLLEVLPPEREPI